MQSNDYRALADGAYQLALQAGREIMRLYAAGVATRTKADNSPVTEADELADRLIVAGLRALTPDIPIVSEEGVAAGVVPDIGGGRFWLVDPLDGTKEFIGGTDEFTVNIALVADGRPLLGVLHVPARDECYIAEGPERALFRAAAGAAQPLRARAIPAGGPVVLASRHHRDAATEAFIAEQGAASVTSAGSALKFALIAKGAADLYPRFGRTMEWDTAAGHAVLAAAGGSVKRLDGSALSYGKPGFANPEFIARGLA